METGAAAIIIIPSDAICAAHLVCAGTLNQEGPHGSNSSCAWREQSRSADGDPADRGFHVGAILSSDWKGFNGALLEAIMNSHSPRRHSTRRR
jgi:hypothetical protein